MIKTAAGIIIMAMLATPTGIIKDKKPDTDNWRSLGKYRITTYCADCNEPIGHQSASGKTLKYGHVAMNGVPLGSKINIEGEPFTVTDRCGIDNTVDIFIPNGDGVCRCNTLDFKEVKIND